MNLQSLKDIPSSFFVVKMSLIVSLLTTVVAVVGSLFWAYTINEELAGTGFILTEDGKAAMLKGVKASEIDQYRVPEIINHAKTFHKLFWNIDQFNYERSINEALYLIGDSGKQMYLSLKAQGHFSKIDTQNLTQEIAIDSIAVNDRAIPYQCELYGMLKVKRTDQDKESVDPIVATFELHNVSRTEKNPHGLLIENYLIKSNTVPK